MKTHVTNETMGAHRVSHPAIAGTGLVRRWQALHMTVDHPMMVSALRAKLSTKRCNVLLSQVPSRAIIIGMFEIIAYDMLPG